MTKKTRRSRNEGMVRYLESKKLYEARYTIGVNEYGKTIYKSIYGKKKTGAGGVLERMRDALSALGKGEYVDLSDKSLISVCREWYELKKEPVLKINTKLKYDTSITRLEKSAIASMRIKDINSDIIQKYYNDLKKQGKSSETIRSTHTLINGALEYAESTNKINKNPAKKVIIPKNDIKETVKIKALTDSEHDSFMFQLGRRSKYYMFALFMLNTGLRPGEALALYRSDINFNNCTVTVNKTYLEATKEVQFSTKTVSSNRMVPIPSDIIKLIKEFMLQQPNKKASAPLFQSSNGKRPSQSYLRKRFKFSGEKSGVPWVNLHTMRHTYASRLFKEKVDIKIISRLLGHKDVSTTYDIYVHFIDNVVEDSVQVLNAGLPELLPHKSQKKIDNVKDIKIISTT